MEESQYTRICPNCAANVAKELDQCDRCHERWSEPGTGRPQFSQEAREAGEDMGGLLRLYPTESPRARFVAACPAGAFAVDAGGKLLWVADWGYMSSVDVDGAKLRLNGKLADLETGELLADE